MKQIKITFAELYCLILTVLCFLFICVVLSFIIRNPNSLSNATVASLISGIVAAILLALASCYKFITASTAGSQAKDEAAKDTTDNLVNQLANSAPIPNEKA